MSTTKVYSRFSELLEDGTVIAPATLAWQVVRCVDYEDLAAENALLKEVVRAADAYSARVSEIANSDAQRGLESMGYVHGFRWPVDLNWVKERDAYGAARAKVTL